MTNRDAWRRATLPGLRGAVLDVGSGVGGALPYLADSTVDCLEPRPSRRLREAAATHGARVIAAAAEDIPVADNTYDIAICSAVLCSVRDPDRTLRELRRILRPGGRLEFYEHVGSAAGTGSLRFQRAIAPISRVLDGGCDPSRDTVGTLQRSPFRIDELRQDATRGPFGLETVHIRGSAH